MKPNILFVFARDGQQIVAQEEDRNLNGRPDRLTRFDESGTPTYRCTMTQEVTFVNGQPSLVLDDSTGDRFADRRQVYEGSELVRLEADTNADRRPDVWITYRGGQAAIQDEDADYDGRVDQRFDLTTEEQLEVEGSGEPPSRERFARLQCSGFSALWRR
jgi:hypothetical protein